MIVVIHTYCAFDYQKILMQRFKRMRMSGLLEATDKIIVPVVNKMRDNDQKFFEDFKKLSPKIEVFELHPVVFGNECDTLNWLKMYVESNPDQPILYTHTKGVTQLHPTIKKNVELWVKYLEYWCIWLWRDCVAKLKDYDASGGKFIGTGIGSHFQGNFYWVNSSYLKTLPYIGQQLHNRINRGEFWISQNKDFKAFDVNSLEFPEGHDFYRDHYIVENLFPQGF
jgi:hypothetical protein